jgi:Flp pilus assembly protein TadD
MPRTAARGKRRLDRLARLLGAAGLAALLAGCATGAPDPEPADGVQAQASLEQGLRLARASHQGGNPTAAARLYRRFAEQHPDDPRPYLGLGRALLAARATHEAIAAFERVRDTELAAPAETGLGRAYLQLRRPDRALEYLDRAIARDARDVTALNARGVALDMLGRGPAAQASYDAAIAAAPGFVDARVNRALSRALDGDTQAALEALRGVVGRDDSGARARQNLALVYGLAGNVQAAQRIGLQDLDADAVAENLRFYAMLRGLDSRRARMEALLSRTGVSSRDTDGLTRAERRDIERHLGAMDFAVGRIDGRIDAKTQQAIRRFQKVAGLRIDGRASRALLDELREVAGLLGRSAGALR